MHGRALCALDIDQTVVIFLEMEKSDPKRVNVDGSPCSCEEFRGIVREAVEKDTLCMPPGALPFEHRLDRFFELLYDAAVKRIGGHR